MTLNKIKHLIVTSLTSAALILSGCSVTTSEVSAQFGSNSVYKNYYEPTVEDTIGDDLEAFDLTDERDFGYFSKGRDIHFEGLFGIHLETEGDTITYSLYTHHRDETAIDGFPTLYGRLGNGKKLEMDLPAIPTWNKEATLSTRDLPNGKYLLEQKFLNTESAKYDTTIRATFVIQNGIAHCCLYGTILLSDPGCSVEEARLTYQSFFKNYDPKKQLDTSNLSYPTRSRNLYHANKELCDLADSLVADHPEWDDDMKVFAVVYTLSTKYAFDNWRCHQPSSRANMNGTLGEPSDFMPTNHVGVCWDFANVMTIMLRHLGVPCVTVCSYEQNHMFNAVYLYDEWVSFDVSRISMYDCDGEDTSREAWEKHLPSTDLYGIYQIPGDDFEINNDELFTYNP